jgi:hypothetical protein
MNLTDKYLINPFMKEVNHTGFPTSNNVFKMIIGTTGLGKTYTTFNTFIPYLFDEKDLDVILFTYPLTEVYNEEDAFAVELQTKNKIKVVDSEGDLTKVPFLVSNGFKVFIPVTHQKLINSSNKFFIDNLVQQGLKVGWFVDEPHTWLACSDKGNYKDSVGSHNILYNASLYKEVSKISAISPYVFGTTATPTAEHQYLIEPFGDMKFKIINTYPTTQEMISRAGWFGGEQYFDINNENETLYVFNNFVDRHMEKNELFGKRVMMIQCGRSNSKIGYTVEEILDLLKQNLSNSSNLTNNQIAVLTHDFKGYVSFKKTNFNNNTYQVIYEDVDEQQVIRDLNNPNHPSKFVLFVEKGKCGLNVHCLKSFFSFRTTDKKTSSRLNEEPITNQAIQILGRMMRIWTGMSNKDFVKQWGYDLTNYVKSLNTVQKNTLLELNSFDICVPDNDMWRATVKDVRTKFNPSKVDASSWISNL